MSTVIRSMPGLSSNVAILPLAAVHAFSFVAWLVLLGGISSCDHQLGRSGYTSTDRENGTAFLWFLLAAYAMVMGLQFASLMVEVLRPLQLFAAYLLAVELTWLGYETNQLFYFERLLDSDRTAAGDLGDDVAFSFPHRTPLLHGIQATLAGAILCIFALLAALALLTIHMSTSGTSVPHHLSSREFPAASGGNGKGGGAAPPAPGMLYAKCPKCSQQTAYPPDFDAVCCSNCQNIIQIGPAKV